MVKVLHIVATPRGIESNCLRASQAFLNTLRDQLMDVDVDTIDLYDHSLPSVAGDNIKSKYTLMAGMPIDDRHARSWREIEMLIEHFLSADLYLISAPMWNLGIPYALKYYIDCIVQPGYLFSYNSEGQVVPLVTNRKMVCSTSRGGDYSPGSYMHAYDFQEPYLRAIFGFVGVTDIEFINAEPTDVTLDLREAALARALQRAVDLATQIAADTPIGFLGPDLESVAGDPGGAGAAQNA